MAGLRVFLPIPNFEHPISVDNADIMYQASEKFVIEPSAKALELFHIEAVCEVCGPIGVGLKIIGLAQGVNESITIEGHLYVHDVYFSKPPLITPLDSITVP
jgi:hypothetical protein